MIRIIEGSKDEEYTLGDLIKYVADKEGAHWDFKKHSSLDRIENISNPSNITYPHWVVLCVACYIYTRIHEGMKTNEGAWRQELQQLWMDTGSEDQAVLPDLEYMGMLLAAERNTRGHGSRNMGVIPFNREPQGNEVNEIWVRTRIDMETAVDAQVRYDAGGASEVASNFRWVGKPQEGIRLQIHEGHSVVREAAPGLWLPQ